MKIKTFAYICLEVIIGLIFINCFDPEEIKYILDQFMMNEPEITEQEYYTEFDYFAAKYRKSYAENSEYQKRFMIFKRNYKFIKTHNFNAKIHGYKLGVNKFADLTNDEYRKTYLETFKLNSNISKVSEPDGKFKNRMKSAQAKNDFYDLGNPSSVDWRNTGAVMPVKDQGECISGYAFSAIAAIEGVYAIQKKRYKKLSEQQVIDCSDSDTYGNKGCEGGNTTAVFKYAHDNDLCIEEDYEYTGTHDSCQAFYK